MGGCRELLRLLQEQRPRKLFKYLYELPNYGVGRRFTRVIWKHESVSEGEDRWGDPTSYWTITEVKPDGVSVVHVYLGFHICRYTLVSISYCLGIK